MRHAAFWIFWWLYFIFTFYIPTFQFIGYNTNGSNPLFEQLGLMRFIWEVLIYKSLIPVILPQIAYTYLILYYGLPNYLFNKKNTVSITVIFSAWMLIIYCLSFALMYVPSSHMRSLGINLTSGSLLNMFHFVNKSYLFHLPIVVAYALLIKLSKQWWLKKKRTNELAIEKVAAELKLLKAQIHPHFLFNTLNNIYYLLLAGSSQGSQMIKKLILIYHYIVNDSNLAFVSLDHEFKLIEDYISLEKIRYGDKINLTLVLPENLNQVYIAPLILIPFVENSFKHGSSQMIQQPWIKVSASVVDNELLFVLINSKQNSTEIGNTVGGIGLANARKRLQLLYPGAHELNIMSDTNRFTITLKIKLKNNVPFTSEMKSNPTMEYAID